MNESAGELSLRTLRTDRAPSAPVALREDAGFPPSAPPSPRPAAAPTIPITPEPRPRFFADPSRIPAALAQHSGYIVAVGLLAALGAGLVGYLQSNYSVRAILLTLAADPAPASGPEAESFHPRPITPPTLVALLQSPELWRRATAQIQPPAAADAQTPQVLVAPVANTELVSLTVTGKRRQSLVALANRMADQAVALGRELQLAEADQLVRFCDAKITQLDHELQQVNAELSDFQRTEKLADPDVEKQGYLRQLGDVQARADNARIEGELLDLQIATVQNELAQQSPVAQRLETARARLAELLEQYTEKHPAVQTQRQLLADLEKQLPAAGPSSLAAARYSNQPEVKAQYARLRELQTRKATAEREFAELASLHESLLGKVRGLSEKSLRYETIKARFDGLQKSRGQLAARARAAQLYQANAQGYFRVSSPAALNDVNARARWQAALLAGTLGLLAGGLVAGLAIAGRELTDRRLKTARDVQRATGLPVLATLGDLRALSAAETEAWAFRAWTAIAGQLSASPNQGMVCGFISSQAGEGRSTWIELLVTAAKQRGLQVMKITTQPGDDNLPGMDLSLAGPISHWEENPPDRLPAVPSLAVGLANVDVPMPVPGKVWQLAPRKDWQRALAELGRRDNLVLLVELPPASMPEAVLLAESLPQIIWLTDSGRIGDRETQEQLQTLRHAKCRLVGAVLNHEP